VSGPGQGPGTGWRETVFGPRRGVGALATDEARSPGGWLAMAALALLVASQFFRWGWWEDSFGRIRDVGYMGQSAGGLGGIVAAAGLVLAIRARSGAGSGLRIVQYLPLILGVAALLFAASGLEQAYSEMLGHRSDDQAAGLDVGGFIAVAGGVCATVGGLLATLARRRNPRERDAAEPARPGRGADGPTVPVERLHGEGRTR